MEIDDLKKVWTKINSDSDQVLYSSEEIADFRKSRSKDFSVWIQNGLILDIVLKGILILVLLYLILLLKDSSGYIFTASGIVLISLILILFEFRHFRSSKRVDTDSQSVQDGIKAKLKYLKTYYYRIQFLQGLTNPIFVFAGVSYYYYQKYGAFKIDDNQDLFIFLLLLLISFLFTLPTTFSLYGYHYKVMQTTLASLEDEQAWVDAIKKYKRQKRILTWVLGSLLIIGVVVLVYLILL